MFKRPTVIVVGAGASKDLEFPTGDELRYQLSNTFARVRTDGWNLDGPPALLAGIRSHASQTGAQSLDGYLAAARTLASHMLYARSIDEFVDHYQGDALVVLLAKMGICAAILEKEKSSNLFKKREPGGHNEVNHEYLDKQDVWLKQLWYMMRQEVRRDQPAQLLENVSFINFNYDRTLEAFLTRALMDMYGLPEQRAIELIENAPIYHPYGMVDRLTATPFGGGSAHPDLLRLKDNIRTYTESEVSPQKRDYESLLANATNIVFLGFAYRQLNLELLRSARGASLSIFGTAVGIPEENFTGIEGRLNGVLQPTNGVLHVHLRGVKSAELLRLNEESLIS